MTVFNFLQCLFGLFCSRFNAYNLESLLGLNITLAKIITSGFCGVFSKTIFRLLQSDSTQYKPPSPKKRGNHSVDSCTPHSQTELNLLHRNFENFLRPWTQYLKETSRLYSPYLYLWMLWIASRVTHEAWLRTCCPHHSHRWCCPTGTKTSMRDANTSPLHDGSVFTTTTVCGHGKLCAGEPTAFTRHLILLFRWTPPTYREWEEFTIGSCWTTKLGPRAAPSRRPTGATATFDIWTKHPHIDSYITTPRPRYEYLLFGWWGSRSGTIRPFHSWNGWSKLGILWKDSWILTTVLTTGVCTTSNALILFTTNTCSFTMVWPNYSTSPTTAIFPTITSYDRPASTDNYPCLDPSPRRGPRITDEIYPVRSSPIEGSQSAARHTWSPPQGFGPSSSRGKGNTFAPTQGTTHKTPGPNFGFH